MHRRVSDPGRDGVPMRAWHAMGPPQHGRVAGHPPASGGVTSHPADSTGTWQPPWPQSGGGKVQISPVRCAPSLPSPHGVGSQPTIPSAQGERAGCAQGRGLSILELQVVLELHQPPAPPGWSQPHLQALPGRRQHCSAQALTSKAAMPAATPPTTPALVLISSRICGKQPCRRQPHG